MSCRKDRDRYQAMQGLDPDYQGFRGHANEPSRPGKAPLATAVCAACGRKKNVPVGVAVEQGDTFVCATCAEEGRSADSAEERTAASPSS